MHNDRLFFYAANCGEHVYCWAVACRFEWDEVRHARFAPPANDQPQPLPPPLPLPIVRSSRDRSAR